MSEIRSHASAKKNHYMAKFEASTSPPFINFALQDLHSFLTLVTPFRVFPARYSLTFTRSSNSINATTRSA